MKATGFASLGVVALLSGSADAAAPKHGRLAAMEKLGYDHAYFAKKNEQKVKLAPQMARLEASHENRRRHLLRQAEDSTDLVYTIFSVFDGLVHGASYEEAS